MAKRDMAGENDMACKVGVGAAGTHASDAAPIDGMAPVDAAPEMPGFSLGTPALVCRWRLAGRTLPLANRHMRALAARRVRGTNVSPELVAWAKQQVEWSLDPGSLENPDGVLMLIVDEAGQAAMTVGPYQALLHTGCSSLAERAQLSQAEAASTGVAPESLWGVADGALLWGTEAGHAASGIDSLVCDLARTLGIPVTRRAGLARQVMDGEVAPDEVFLASDEHGVVPASDRRQEVSARLAGGYARLLAKAAGKSQA